jgi:hypothetical protein
MRRVVIAAGTLVLGLAFAALARCPTGPVPATSVQPAPLPICALTRPVLPIRNTPVTALCDDVYAENGLAPVESDALRKAWVVAAGKLNVAFETARSSPVVVFCRSAACKMAFGASPQAAAADDLGFASAQVMVEDGSLVPSAVVVTGPVAATARILTHELVHAEMKAWVAYDLLPTWFNEGTATFLAGEPRCEPSAAPKDFDVKRLTTKTLWQHHLQSSGRTRETYCAARREVESWMVHFDGDHARAAALRALMTSVAQGSPFDRALAAAH